MAIGLVKPPSPARQAAGDPAAASGVIRPLPPVSGSTRSLPASRGNALGAAEPSSTRDRPGTAGRTRAAGVPAAGTTQLRCGGCRAHARYAQDEPCYGQLVRAFLGQHEVCGNAVKITRVRVGQS